MVAAECTSGSQVMTPLLAQFLVVFTVPTAQPKHWPFGTVAMCLSEHGKPLGEVVIFCVIYILCLVSFFFLSTVVENFEAP